MTRRQMVGTGCGALVLMLVGVSAVLWRFAPSLCANVLVADTPSPDGSRRLVTFVRDCGATTSWSTQVSLVDADFELDERESGNVFIADRADGRAPSGPGGGPEVRTRWTGMNRAVIEHHSKARVFKAEPVVDDVRLDFVALDGLSR